MRDGNNDAPESAVRQVAALKEGEAYCRAEFIPAFRVTPDRIRRAKRDLSHNLSPVVARAREKSPARYRLLTTHSFTMDYDIIVAGVIVRTPDL